MGFVIFVTRYMIAKIPEAEELDSMPYPKQPLTIRTCLGVVFWATLVCAFAGSSSASQISGSGSITTSHVVGNWYQPCTVDSACINPTTTTFVLASACPNIPNLDPTQPPTYTNNNPNAPGTYGNLCGFSYFNGLTQFNGKNGWHGYTSGTVQAYLNGLTSGTSAVSFNLNADASLHWYDSSEASPSEPYRHPSGDYGYYLSAYDTSNTPGLTICAGGSVSNCSTGTESSGFSKVAFYWGSIDPWNKIGFCHSDRSCDYVYGSDLSGFTINDNTSNGRGPIPNINGAVVSFQPSRTGGPWAYITFTSCNSSGNCNPAFELDDLQYLLTPCNPSCNNPPPSHGEAPVPEPMTASLLIAGAALALKQLRRSI